MFDTVVILDEVVRQAGDDPDVLSFRSLLMRMRDGRVTEQDWHLLLQRSPSNVHMLEFADAIQLFYDMRSDIFVEVTDILTALAAIILTLKMTLKMTAAKAVETSVTSTNSLSQDYTNLDDQLPQTCHNSPRFKPFT